MKTDILSLDLYRDLVFNVNNLELDFSLDKESSNFSILGYYLYRGCNILFTEELKFLNIGLDMYPEILSKFDYLNKTNDIFLLEELITLYGSQSNLRYDKTKLSMLKKSLMSKLGNLEVDNLEIFMDNLLDDYNKKFVIKTVGSYLDYLLNVLKKL